MGWTSQDDMINEITNNGKFHRFDWNKLTVGTFVAGRWYDMSGMAGTPIANPFGGSALACQNVNESTGWGIYNGGNVSTDTKHLVNQMAVANAATGVPSLLQLVDIQCMWTGINCNTLSAQTLTGTPTLRYTNGAGCRLYFVANATIGSNTHNIAVSYLDQAGATKTLPVTVACSVSSIASTVIHSGVAANNYGPFLPMASGTTGITGVNSVTFSAASGTVSTGTLFLARPIAAIPCTTVSVAAMIDHLNQFPSLPRIYDGACLSFIYGAGANTAAATALNGALEFGWG